MSNGDQLSNEVAELLTRTDSLLRTTSSSGRALSDDGRVGKSSSFRVPAMLPGRSFGRTASVRSSMEETGFAGRASPRQRGFAEGPDRKHGDFKKASFKVPLTVDIPFKDAPEAATPRFTDSPMSRIAPSTVFTDGAGTAILERSVSAVLTQQGPSAGAGAGRYNSFEGLQDMVSLVDEMVAPSSPRSVAGRSTSSRLGLAGTASRGLVSELKTSLGTLRSPSRLGSPAASPRSSPLRRGGSPATSASSGQGSRRAQLQALLSRDVAQPQDVARFKAELSSQARPPAAVTALAGSLQEKFDRVQRKLNNWELIETAATERFNTAMDAALDALFSRIDLSWPTDDLPRPAGGASRQPAPSKSAHASSRERSGASNEPSRSRRSRPENANGRADQRDSSASPRGSCRNSGSSDNGSPASTSTVSKLHGWDDLSSSETEDQAARQREHLGSGSDTSAASMHRGGSRGDRKGASRHAVDRHRERDGRSSSGRHQMAGPDRPVNGRSHSRSKHDAAPATASHATGTRHRSHAAPAMAQQPVLAAHAAQPAYRHGGDVSSARPAPYSPYSYASTPASPLSSGSDGPAPPVAPTPWSTAAHGGSPYGSLPAPSVTGSGSVATADYMAAVYPPAQGPSGYPAMLHAPKAAWAPAPGAPTVFSAPAMQPAATYPSQRPVLQSRDGMGGSYLGVGGMQQQPSPGFLSSTNAPYVAQQQASAALPAPAHYGAPAAHPMPLAGHAAQSSWPRSAMSTVADSAAAALASGNGAPGAYAAAAPMQHAATAYQYGMSPQSPTLHRLGGYSTAAGMPMPSNMPIAVGGAHGQPLTPWRA